jgi:hypothetical protein
MFSALNDTSEGDTRLICSLRHHFAENGDLTPAQYDTFDE